MENNECQGLELQIEKGASEAHEYILAAVAIPNNDHVVKEYGDSRLQIPLNWGGSR